MKRIILLRHGESEWNLPCAHAERKFTGQHESPLTAQGKRQAMRAAFLLAEMRCSIDRIVCSSIGRAVQTARIVRSTLGEAVPMAIHDGLRERSLGAFEGRLVEDVLSEHPELRDDFSFCNDFVAKAPGGENLSEVTDRAWKAWESVSLMEGEDALIVSHAVTIRCLVGRALRLSEEDTKRIQVPNAAPLLFGIASEPVLLHPAALPSSVPLSSSIL